MDGQGAIKNTSLRGEHHNNDQTTITKPHFFSNLIAKTVTYQKQQHYKQASTYTGSKLAAKIYPTVHKSSKIPAQSPFKFTRGMSLTI